MQLHFLKASVHLLLLLSDGPHVYSSCSWSSRGPRALSALYPLFLLTCPARFKPKTANGEDTIHRHQHPRWRHLGSTGGRPGLSGALPARDQCQPGRHRLARDRGRSAKTPQDFCLAFVLLWHLTELSVHLLFKPVLTWREVEQGLFTVLHNLNVLT